MYVSKEAISVLFRIINFVIIFWVFRYLFKKYLPAIKKSFFKKLAFFDNLEKQRLDLIEQNRMLVKEMQDQDNLFDLLKEKIKIWNMARHKKIDATEKEIEQLKELTKKRNKIQQENVHQKKLIKEIFPKAIAGTYKALEEKFEKKEESKKYLNNIIGYMKKSAGITYE